jgi:hypothetical protein
MISKTVTYTDFNGLERTEEHLFNLSKAEVATMEMSTQDGLGKKLQDIVNSKDGATIIATFKSIVLDSYGKKSEDGRSFFKSQQLRDEFASTEAYSEIFWELATNADAASAFVRGILPKTPQQDIPKLD